MHILKGKTLGNFYVHKNDTAIIQKMYWLFTYICCERHFFKQNSCFRYKPRKVTSLTTLRERFIESEQEDDKRYWFVYRQRRYKTNSFEYSGKTEKLKTR